MDNDIVCKFGGSSLCCPGQIRNVVDIIRSDPRRKYIVVSAPGKSPDLEDDERLTDILIALANGDDTYSIKDVERKFRNTGLDRYEDVHSHNMKKLNDYLDDESGSQEMRLDRIKSCGEDFMARLMAEHLGYEGLDAKCVSPKDLMVVSSDFGNAKILDETYDRLSKLKESESIVVFPGFFGFDKFGNVVTFKRGGSDLTGSVLAAAVGASVYENWTDTDGIRSANPKLIVNSRTIDEISYGELRELTYMGFDVFHDDAMFPVIDNNIMINVRNTNNKDHPGTMIVSERMLNENDMKYLIVGVAHKSGFCTINLEKRNMNEEKGFGEKVLEVLRYYDISFEHTLTSIDVMSVVLDRSQFKKPGVLHNVINDLKTDTGAKKVYLSEDDLALLNVVGYDLKGSIGVASRVSSALLEQGINIELMNHGANPRSMIFGIKEQFAEDAVRAVYDNFFGEN